MEYGDNLTYGKKRVKPDGVQKIYIGTTTGRYNGKSLLEKHLENLKTPPITINAALLDHAFDEYTEPKYHEHAIAALKYWRNDVEITKKCCEDAKTIIKKVIFNDPATIVLWGDGTKTVVKCEEEYDPEKGLAMAIAKHFLGTNKSKSNYYDVFEKWLPKEVTDLPMIPKPQENIGETVGRILRENALKGMAFKFNTEESDENGAEDNN